MCHISPERLATANRSIHMGWHLLAECGQRPLWRFHLQQNHGTLFLGALSTFELTITWSTHLFSSLTVFSVSSPCSVRQQQANLHHSLPKAVHLHYHFGSSQNCWKFLDWTAGCAVDSEQVSKSMSDSSPLTISRRVKPSKSSSLSPITDLQYCHASSSAIL